MGFSEQKDRPIGHRAHVTHDGRRANQERNSRKSLAVAPEKSLAVVPGMPRRHCMGGEEAGERVV